MKLTVPDICETIRLADFAPEFGDTAIHVWVNPPRSMLTKQEGAENIYRWYADIWSKGPEDTRWTAEEVQDFAEQVFEHSPALWEWLATETARLIVDHRKKKPKS
jgi:hypothetical protein